MSAECRPPEGTPDGAVCWLYYDRPDGGRDWCALPWRPIPGSGNVWGGVYDVGANRAARFGWRFHSLATPPEDKP